MVVFLCSVDESPDQIHENQCFGPAHMPVASDHVHSQETAFGRQAGVDLGEQSVELDHMMKRMMGHEPIDLLVQALAIDVEIADFDKSRQALPGNLDLGFAKKNVAYFEALNLKIFKPLRE